MTRRIDAYSLRLFVSTARAGSIVRGAAPASFQAELLKHQKLVKQSGATLD